MPNANPTLNQSTMQQSPELSPFDPQAYISRYDPNSHLQRLLFLAHHFHSDNGNQTQTTDSSSNNDNITREAFELAVNHMQRTGNYRRYLEEFGAVVESSALGSPPSAGEDANESSNTTHAPRSSSPHPHSSNQHTQQYKHIIQQYQNYDGTFVTQSKMTQKQMLETLEGRLSTAQSHLMKESIRTALIALAEFHRDRGELREAWRRVARSREYCATGPQHTQVCLMLVEFGIDLKEWSSVRDTISRAEHTVMGDINDVLFHQKLRAGQALVHLAEGRYLESAKLFTSIDPKLTNQFNSVISAEDLAMFGALLGLATMDRTMLHSAVIDGAFKGRLELVPNMREALRHYSRAEYGQCLELLQTTIQRDLLVDIHLHAHVPILLDMIRDRCIVQYFQPYSSVSLEKMGDVFGCSVKEMEDVVAKLISNGGVDGISLGEGARINALEKTLNAEKAKSVEKKARRKVRVNAAKMGVLFNRNAEGMILRIACMDSGIAIQDKRSGWRNRGGKAARDRHAADRMIQADQYESDISVDEEPDLDDMEIEHHLVNPNDI